jgi:hypothetical protein
MTAGGRTARGPKSIFGGREKSVFRMFPAAGAGGPLIP